MPLTEGWRGNEAEPYKRFSVTETSDAFASGEDFAIWDDIRDEYYHDSDGTVHTFATREEAGEYLEQVEKETDRQEAAEWAYVERAKSEAGQETSGHRVQKLEVEPEKSKPEYKIGDTVTIEGTEFIIENISDMEVQLRDTKLLYPIFRAESRENFERLLAQETEIGRAHV